METTRKLIISQSHLGKNYVGEIATIKATYLGNGEASRGIMSADLICEWYGGGVSVGGIALDEWNEYNSIREGSAFGLDFIMNVMSTVGVESWEQLKGKNVIVLFDENYSGLGNKPVGIAGLENNKIMVFSEYVEYWKEKNS